MSTVILAESIREANAYCVEKGIRALFAKSPAQVRQATTIIELPGFAKRRDRFSLGQSRDARIRYGKNIEYILESDWVRPVREVAEPEPVVEQIDERTFYASDLTDPRTLVELKVELNKVGWTLKKLPTKKRDES
jgi:hypothetical protein